MSRNTQKIRFERTHGDQSAYRDSRSYQMAVQEWYLLQGHREHKMPIVRLQDVHLLHGLREDPARDLWFVHQEPHPGLGALQQVVDGACNDRLPMVEHRDVRRYYLNLVQQVGGQEHRLALLLVETSD